MSHRQPPLICSSPAFRSARLAQIELGRLVLLRAGSDCAAGLGVRTDAVSARAELTEGVLRLSPAVRFERRALDDGLIELEIDYLIEPDFLELASRPALSGDLLIAAGQSAVGVYVAQVWPDSAGVLELHSGLIRPAPPPRAGMQIALGWRLLEQARRERVLFDRPLPPAAPLERLRRVHGEDCD